MNIKLHIFHYWEYGDNVRQCKVCNKKQWYMAKDIASGIWINHIPECEECGGQGYKLNEAFERVTCKYCNGSGEMY